MSQDKRKASSSKKGLPSLDVRFSSALDHWAGGRRKRREKIPNASLVYGIASAILFTVSLYYLFTGLWFTSLLVLVVAGALFGYALVYLRYASED